MRHLCVKVADIDAVWISQRAATVANVHRHVVAVEVIEIAQLYNNQKNGQERFGHIRKKW